MGTRARRENERSGWTAAGVVIFAAAGILFVSGAVNSNGADLRPADSDVSGLLQERSQRVDVQRTQAQKLRDEIDSLSRNADDATLDKQLRRVDDLVDDTGLTKVSGSGMRVTLTDAPRSSDEPGVDPNVLVVHQQDIQGFVNALWAGGARAITLQGERLISTTGIKCVGNTVVLDGVPYSPPYVIEAVGDPIDLEQALSDASDVVIYKQYVERYKLGLDVKTLFNVTAEPYAGTVGLEYASTTTVMSQ